MLFRETKMPAVMDIAGVIWLSLASAAISYTVADALIFKPLRELVASKSTFFGHLLCCGYCTGYWVSLALEIIFLPNLFNAPFIGHILTWFIMAWLSGFQWVLMCILADKAGK